MFSSPKDLKFRLELLLLKKLRGRILRPPGDFVLNFLSAFFSS